MEKDTSFLFRGISFDRKKFARDIARFQVKGCNKDDAEKPISVEVGGAKEIVINMKRKSASLESLPEFKLFKSSEEKSVAESGEHIENEVLLQKKAYHRKLERDAVLRKSHGIHVSGSNVPSPLQDFSELRKLYKCKSYLIRNLNEFGFKEPTPIQRQTIPVLLSRRECFACAPTGSGKTFAFICPILMKLERASKDGVRAVILCPTRELSAQTARECKKLATGKKFYIKVMTKKLAKTGNFAKLPCDILISTPSRVLYAVQKRKLNLANVKFLVLDESDQLFELGLIKEVDAVVKECSNPSILRSLFSATLPDTVEELARTIMHDAVRVIIGQKNSACHSIKQKLVFVGSEEGKLFALRQSFNESLNPPVLLFVQNKERAKQLYSRLKYDDIRADIMHADLSQFERDIAVDNFRSGKTWVLIATDVIARGMDFKGVKCVINYDFPDSSAAYIHRIGRTGRAGREGEAITFYTESDVPYLKNIGNVMAASGCEVPEWIMSLPKKKWKEHRPNREAISSETEE